MSEERQREGGSGSTISTRGKGGDLSRRRLAAMGDLLPDHDTLTQASRELFMCARSPYMAALRPLMSSRVTGKSSPSIPLSPRFSSSISSTAVLCWQTALNSTVSQTHALQSQLQTVPGPRLIRAARLFRASCTVLSEAVCLPSLRSAPHRAEVAPEFFMRDPSLPHNLA